MSTSKELLLKLLYANTEAELGEIINADPAMRSADNWHPLDGRDTNFNVVSNQSSNGAKAATELMTNMVDAVLMKRCHEEGIDPKGKDAPKTMYDAVDRFIFSLNGGKIIKADQQQLRLFAEQNLIIGVSGGRTKDDKDPCFTFCDNGEGQHPASFASTFLSFSAKNKSEISFVQGKYNMGSSGVLSFCGGQWYKLIISRRYDKKGDWGWTLLRRNTPERGTPYAEYYAPNKEVPTVDGQMSIVPFKTKQGKVYGKYSLESGTIVKLYEYHLGKGHSGFRQAREALNENLVETILPFRIWDFRWSPQKGKGAEREVGLDSRSFYGMEYLLARGHAEELDDESAEGRIISIDNVYDPRLGMIRISAIVMKKSSEKTMWYKRSNNRIFHHVNGQVMFKDGRGYLTQRGFPALKDRVVIFVDASNLTDSAHLDLWKGDRESIRETRDIGNLYKEAIGQAIKHSSLLKALNHKIAHEELETATKDSSRELVKQLVKSDNNFKALLSDKVPDISVGGNVKPKEDALREDLKRCPSYIKLSRSGDKMIEMPINISRPIPFETDAQDDFFTRPDNAGYPLLSSDQMSRDFVWRHNLRNGKFVLYLDPVRENVKVGDKYSFKVCLHSAEMPESVCAREEITVSIVEARSKPPNPNPRPPKERTDSIGLPPCDLLTKDGRTVMDGTETISWESFDGYQNCGKEDGGFISDFGEQGKKHYVNYDNVFFQSYLRQAKEEKSSAEKKYILGMRILMLGMEFGLKQGMKRNEETYVENIDEIRRAVAQGAASTVLTLCDKMPKNFDLFKDSSEE